MAFTGHNTAAPGFGRAYNPFDDLSGDHDNVEAIDFEDTYDGLGGQLDDDDDVFNDDTFGGADSGPSRAPVGKDFDFFGQTAKVAGAIDEEHQRFERQQPARKTTAFTSTDDFTTGYAYQPAPKPARTGYEKYKLPEPVSELQIDASIWGAVPKKTATTAAATATQAQPAAATPKKMSLEEVEAAMRARTKPATPSQPAQQQQNIPAAENPISQRPIQQQESYDYHHRHADQRQGQGYPPNENRQTAQGGPHGHPVTILQRPSSGHVPPVGPPVPSPLSQQQQQQQKPPPPMAPTQILQNPNRLSGDAARMGIPPTASHRSQNSFSRQPPISTHPSQHLSDQEKATFLEAETRRAKRNHKIFILSKDNGLMTPQDKSFITRIQLQQLVSATGDPGDHGTDAALEEDFYYQVHSSLRTGPRSNPNQPLTNFAQTYLFQTGTRQGGMRRHARGPENHMQRMEQQVQRAVEAAKNKPKNKQLVIEGSLGKISFSNAKTPKPLLNIKRTESGTDTPRLHRSQTTGSLDKKVTLRNIEKVYSTIMKLEDVERQVPSVSSNGQVTEEIAEKQREYNQLNEELWDHLNVTDGDNDTAAHPFIDFMSYSKGKKAFSRIYRHLKQEQRTAVLTRLIVQLDQLDVVRGAQVQTGEQAGPNAATRESIELFLMTVMPSIFHLLNDTRLEIVTAVLGIITSQVQVDLIARTRIGVGILTMILSRAELIKQAGQANEQSWQHWVVTFNTFFNTLEPTLPHIFPGTVASGEDIYVWQFLAAIGIGSSPDEQQRLVLAVKDRVMDTVGAAKTLPADMAKERLNNVNLFMRSIGLDVELLN